MPNLASGARQLPTRHISIRVPWNDTDWTGKVCRCPSENVSCLILPRISETRKDAAETALAGKSWQGLAEDQFPVCVGEHGSFMADFEFSRSLTHPYTKSSSAHQHFLPTPFRCPAYSAACIPFNWMLKDSAFELAQKLGIGLQTDLEDNATAVMGFKTEWLQTKYNQLAMLDTFFSALEPQKSLCLFYAKRTPLVDDARRVIIGAGWVTGVGPSEEYQYRERGQLDSMLWERAVHHSIRPKFKDGFLLPYHAMQAYLDRHPEEDPTEYVAFVPDDQFWAFSFGSEHVTNDGAISALLACYKALESMSKVVEGDWAPVLEWIDRRLNELWCMRGPYPGLGAALTAFGVENGTLVAYELERQPNSADVDAWQLIDQLCSDRKSFTPYLQGLIGNTLRRKWAALPAERRALLQLLSRFELTVAQATRYYIHEDNGRQELHIDVADAALLANPYSLYELDRDAADAISLTILDRGLFPDAVLREKFPVPPPSAIEDGVDGRRVRGFVVNQLEAAAGLGHTLLPRTQLIQAIRDLDVRPPCAVDDDLLNVVEPDFAPVVERGAMANGEPLYQLQYSSRQGEEIRKAVEKRLKGQRHQRQVNWRALLDAALKEPAAPGDSEEERARVEKTAVLAELYASRLSVLIGPAGTGKTTLLKVLCNEPNVKQGGILLLAPTGKARVRLETQTEITGAQTIAQFLLPLDRYYAPTGIYRLSDREKIDCGKTVIIDEASMLTEAQLAAVLDAMQGVERLILVGDPRQLPPIGAGRPFLDIVRRLTPANLSTAFPRVAPGYAELTVQRRQKGAARADLLLADWFSGRTLDAGADEVWGQVASGTAAEFVYFVRWDTADDLQRLLLDALVRELGLSGSDDSAGFECSIGGTPYMNSGIFFWAGKDRKPGACGKAEAWQILSPIRNQAQGVEALNRFLQTKFRAKAKEMALTRGRRTPKPMGREGILYGDKVINVQNKRRFDVWPESDALKYVANGEIGIVVGQFKGRSANYRGLPWKLEVEFSSQPSFKYGYGAGDFGEENVSTLELAYALTIHKAQGSEFGVTFLVIPNPCWLLSRELLYTGLTRQQDKVIIFHQGEWSELKRYSDDYYSEAAGRLTNLFRPPQPVELRDRFLEQELIHKTRKGESVRSKSEVIVANLLYDKKVDYVYERPILGADGIPRYPDFTIVDDASGITYYWEHLGMLQSPRYQQRWTRKLAWYREMGILPLEEGGGPNGTLLITRDNDDGGIDSENLEALIGRLF